MSYLPKSPELGIYGPILVCEDQIELAFSCRLSTSVDANNPSNHFFNMIPILRPLLPDGKSLLPYLSQIDGSRIYSNFGPIQAQLTDRLAEYFGVAPQNVLLVTNGTLALAGAVATTSTSANNTWAIPNWTFVATAHAVLLAGGKIKLIDIDRSTWFLNPSRVLSSQNSIITAPFGANPFESKNLLPPIASGHQIIDAASCFDSLRNCGAQIKPHQILMVSLQATKPLSTGEGGLLVGPEDWISEIRRWINFGFWNNRLAHGPSINGKMSEYASAIGCASLDQWVETRHRLKLVLAKYVDLCSKLNWKLQPSAKSGHVTSTINIQFDNPRQKSVVIKRLNRSSIEHRDWWGNGINSLPWMADGTQIFPDTDYCTTTTLGLPFFVDLSNNEFARIQETLMLAKAESSKE